MNRYALYFAASATLVLVLSGCAASSTAEASPGCNDAFGAASVAMNTHYATHPFYGSEYDALYADGTITDEEQVTLDAMLADEQAQYAALTAPIYDACTGVEDLYAGAFAHRDDADWALLDVDSMSREDIKKEFIVSHCYGNESRTACSDFVEDDWR